MTDFLLHVFLFMSGGFVGVVMMCLVVVGRDQHGERNK
jgi:hypothetical protein